MARALRKQRERVVAFAPSAFRFGIVGVANTLVDLAVLNALLFALSHGDSHTRLFPLFATVSFAAATVNSYVLNRRWTFRASGEKRRQEFLRFAVVTVTSFLINVGLSSFLVWLDPLPWISPTLWANAAKLVATGVSLILNFLGYQRLVFRTR